MLYRVSSASCDASKYWRGVRDTNHLNRRSYQLKTLHSQTILPRCLLSICESCKLLANMNINEVKFQELSWRFLPARAFRFGILGSWALANKEKFICCYEWWTFCFVKIENGCLELLGIIFFLVELWRYEIMWRVECHIIITVIVKNAQTLHISLILVRTWDILPKFSWGNFCFSSGYYFIIYLFFYGGCEIIWGLMDSKINFGSLGFSTEFN